MNKIPIIAYPRSGNTYLQMSLDTFIKVNSLDVSIESHGHNPLDLRLNEKSIFILRDPLYAIASFCYMNVDPEYMQRRINTISSLHTFIDKQFNKYNLFITEFLKNNNSKLLPFDYLINEDINIVIANIFNYMGISLGPEIRYLTSHHQDSFPAHNSNYYENNKYGVNFPRGIENDPEYMHIYNSVKNHYKASRTKEVYQEIINKYSNDL